MRLQLEGYHKILMTVLLLPDAEPRDGGGVRDGSLRKSPNEDSTIPANPSMMRWRGLICMYLPKTVFARGGGGFGGGGVSLSAASAPSRTITGVKLGERRTVSHSGACGSHRSERNANSTLSLAT